MAMKRRVIIRETDFKKLPIWEKKKYDSITFEPITKEWLQRQVTWFSMKGNKNLANDYRHWQYPNEMIKRFYKTPLYDRRYKNWLVDYNEQGEMQIRAGINQPLSRVGIAVFRKEEVKEEDGILLE